MGPMAGLSTLAAMLNASLFDPIAADVAATAAPGARILEVGCGGGYLSIRLAARHGFEVTAVDVEPREIERARRNAASVAPAPIPAFLVADVARLPFEDASFDLVVSTFSLHHWSDKARGLEEVARVLRPDGRALIWDLRHGFSLFHLWTPDPVAPVRDSPLDLVEERAWRWPWRFSIARRMDARPARPEA